MMLRLGALLATLWLALGAQHALAQAACAVAAPSCFAGCAAGSVRTTAGQCVPTQRPQDLAVQAPVVPLVAVEPGPTLPAPAPGSPPPPTDGEANGAVEEAPQPAGPACCTMPLSIVAQGFRNLGDHAESQQLAADVRINGQLVGQTPFRDALPAGDYYVEVEWQGAPKQTAWAKLRPGQGASLAARYPLKLSNEQQLQLNAYRTAQKKKIEDKERAQRAEQREQYRREISAWEAETAADRELRALGQPLAIAGMAVGGALTVAGGVLMLVADGTDNDVNATYHDWEVEPLAARRSVLESDLRDLESTRDTQQALGVIGVSVGLVSLTAGIITYVLLPDIPEAPAPPAGLALRPMFGPGMSGARLTGQF